MVRKNEQSKPEAEWPKGRRRGAVKALLDWYDRSGRTLPWRAGKGVTADPYHVWLSEIMLQQTTVKAVAPYFAEFLRRWPRVEMLAAADRDEVLAAWAGLGYYARARNMHSCAQTIVADYGGCFPDTEEALLKLPGVGAYTAAAIAAIAFDRPATVVDGNVERVVSRLFAVQIPMPKAKTAIRRHTATLTPTVRPGDFAQAMMDLGATVCTPRRPACVLCPIMSDCEGRRSGIAESLPIKAVKAERPTREGNAYFAVRSDGAVLLRKRPDKGLLGGMMEVPSGEWSKESRQEGGNGEAPISAQWDRLPGSVRHTFTHFNLELTVYAALVAASEATTNVGLTSGARWVAENDMGDQALPSVMRKVIAHGLEHLFD